VILDNNNDLDKVDTGDKAEGAFSEIDIEYIKWDASLYNPVTTLELVSAPIEPINISGLWYDVKEDYYIEELLALGLRPYE
jgi:hypothetical protein